MASVTRVITTPCIGTKSGECVDVCPVDCIHPTKAEADFPAARMLYINPDECIDCGACEPVCPVEAIFPDDSLPEGTEAFVDLNKRYYTDGLSAAEPPSGAPPASPPSP